MLKVVITNKSELKAAYIKYKIQQEPWGIEVTPQTFCKMIFNNDVRFHVDHDALLASFCEKEAAELVH
jgi:hypothetical protein